MYKRKKPLTEDAPLSLVPQLLTIDQVAALLNVGRSTVYDLINEEGLPWVPLRGGKRVASPSLQWWIEQRECSTLDYVSNYLHKKAAMVGENTPVSVETHKKRGVSKKSV